MTNWLKRHTLRGLALSGMAIHQALRCRGLWSVDSKAHTLCPSLIANLVDVLLPDEANFLARRATDSFAEHIGVLGFAVPFGVPFSALKQSRPEAKPLACEFMVGVRRFELLTSSVSGKRSPPELNARMRAAARGVAQRVSYYTRMGALVQTRTCRTGKPLRLCEP